ncbi:MAG TPA: S8 family peptidase, partial [Terriglobales bacterium]|nr:S8 family peptidase [Terriglobales bacterium]
RAVSATGTRTRVLPLPGIARRWITAQITEAFIRDTHAYFFDPEQRERMQRRLAELLTEENSPYVIVAHSQGSIIAHDVLSGLATRSGIDVTQLVTMGSPLGIVEVQDHMASPLRVPAVVRRWDNFADVLDPVALDKTLADDFARDAAGVRITDAIVVNRDSLRLKGFNPHSGAGYLETDAVRDAVREVVGTAFSTPISSFVIAKDVASDMSESGARVPVLIEVNSDEGAADSSLAAHRSLIVKALDETLETEAARRAAEIDTLKRFVTARLTGAEISRLVARHEELRIANVWKNSRKRKLINASTHTLQAWTAQRGYRATGQKIAWAVLDTGVAPKHPHFARHANVKEAWDCTKKGAPARGAGIDRDGHGTHVAGIIAGAAARPDRTHGELAGMAPECAIHSYKVLNDNGDGEDAWIIKALDHIATVNDNASTLVIHGVNLSLGGYFDPEVFGCGFSPLCRELRRLWQQGVLVVVAAGNEGQMAVQTDEGEADISLDLSIGDPANLDEAIAVGSVHLDHPHMYGISYFSSRGPTADGRLKPDCVAPGEKIISANAAFGPRDRAAYVEMSGTSMAAPHVSGLLAAFLSVRREFIGHPDQVKRILLEHCTDLKRDRYHQGAGMPNLVRMLTGT